MQRQVAILGASTRAMAQSAVRAGYRVVACDLFGDEDLRRIADEVFVIPFDRYPHGCFDIANHLASRPWCYTGGLENYPELLDRLGRFTACWGNGSDEVRRARDVERLSRVLVSSGFPIPRASRSSEIPAGDDRRWLVKSRFGTGGTHVRFWRGEAIPDGWFLQEFIEGRSGSAVYCAAEGVSTLLGATRQILAGDIEPAATTPFQYVGSIGPLPVNGRERERLQRLGDVLTGEFSLRGVFGVDFVQSSEGIWPIEVNPRYPASAEVIERATGTNIFARHAAAFGDERHSIESTVETESRVISECVAKLIVFAPHDGRLKRQAPCYRPGPRDSLQFADVPHPDSVVPAGRPVLTILREGLSFESAIERMATTAHSFLEDWFEKVGPTVV